MKKLTTGASVLLAATLILGACSKHDDAGNTTATDTTVVNDETAVDANATTDNFGAADTLGNGSDAGSALNATDDAGNGSGGNAL